MIRAALEELDLSAVLAAYLDQEKHGHTAESDADLPLDHFASELVSRSQCAGDVMRRGAGRNLPVAYNRAARLAAIALSTMRRIRHEQATGAPIDATPISPQ